ncbi:MAG: PilZ domain-containing protein [Oligoflexia bacterium]|nr:PilZ domain-containing protein [Oligoflexia bacterium]
MDNTDTKKPAERHNIDFDLDFKCNYARDFNKAQIKNLSVTGALIKTDVALKPDERINVFVRISGRERKIPAKVVWIGERGAGIKFNHFNNRDIQIVDDLIYFVTEKGLSTKDLLQNILNKAA